MKMQFSAGGIVYKKQKGEILILLAQHSQHHGWVFPKGLIGDHVQGENKETTSLREVEEETGAIGKIVKELSPVTYWFKLEGELIKKTVYYFLMEYVKGDIAKHDKEMENVEWLLIEEVKSRLTYKSDKEAWQQAQKYLASSF